MATNDWHDAGNSIASSLQNNAAYSNVSANVASTLSTQTTGGIKQLENVASQNTVTTSNYNPYSDEALRAKNGTENVVTTGSTESTTADGSEDAERIWPAAPNNGVMGLPALVGPDDYGSEMGKIFEQSFPIMTIKPYRMIRANTNTVYKRGQFEDVPGGAYRFALQNNGGVKLNISNEFGPSTIENEFRNLAENTFGVIGELNQIVQNNRMMGGPIGQGLMNVKNSSSEMLTKLKSNFDEQMKAIQAKHANSTGWSYGVDAAQAAGDVVNMFAQALIYGNRIDIPDIWKGSKGGLTADIKIDLRARNVGSFDGSASDEEYQNQIITPLKILLALACPLRKTSSKTEGGLTYENPPYLDVTIDKTFTSHCCGISNLSINAPYNEESYYKSRPMHLEVTLQLRELYEVFVWDDKATNNETPATEDDVPSSAMFISRLMSNENGSGLPESTLTLSQGGTSGSNGLSFGSPSSYFSSGSSTSSLFGSTVTNISSLTSNITNPVSNIGESLFTGITSSISSAFVDTITKSTTNLVSSTINSTIGQAQGYLNSTVNSFISQGDALINQSFGSFANAATSGVVTNITNNIVKNVTGNSSSSVSGVISNLFTGVTSFFNGISTEIKKSTPRIVTVTSLNEKASFTLPAELVDSELISVISSGDPVEQVNKAYDVIFVPYDVN